MACTEPLGHYAALKPLMGGRVKVDVIREHWDDIIRLVATPKAGTVLPSAMLRKLAAYERQNQLDLALREVGRVERTLFMLDWLESPSLRRRCPHRFRPKTPGNAAQKTSQRARHVSR